MGVVRYGALVENILSSLTPFVDGRLRRII